MLESSTKSNKLWIIAFSILMIFMYVPAIYHYISQVDINEVIFDDATQYIPSFYKYLPDAIPTTYTDEYYLDALTPFGYKALFIIATKYFDPLSLSVYLPFILLFVTIVIIGFCVRTVSGTQAALCAVMLTISFSGAVMFSFGFAGGVPRAFAFPIVALALLGLVQCRPYLLGIITVFATMFYPVASIISGFAMALMLMLPASYREPIADWSFKKRLFFIIFIAFISALCLIPQILYAVEYGARITPQTLSLFPEAGENGINQPGDRLPFAYDINWLLVYFMCIVSANGEYFSSLHNINIFDNLKVALAGLVFFCIAMGLQQVVKKEHAKIVRILLLLVCALVLFSFAIVLQPYLYMPKRYFLFTIPLIVTVLFPIATIRLLNRSPYINNQNGLAEKLTITLTLAIVLAFGGNGDNSKSKVELSVAEVLYEKDLHSSLKRISELDKNVLIAGWPMDKVVSATKLHARRNTLLTGNRHQALHQKHTLEMRTRMNLLIKAYFATDVKDIIPLSKEYSVTHILIYKKHFEDEHPKYIQPFVKDIENIYKAQKDTALLKDTKKLCEAIVFENGSYVLYDINKIIEILQ
jgi:hypothetical protein